MSDGTLVEADTYASHRGAEMSIGQDRRMVLAWPQRVLLWAGGFLLALWLCLWLGAGVSAHNDFTQNVWLPSRLILDGINPYTPPDSVVNSALGEYRSAFAGFNGGEKYFFIYPLWVALAFTPFGAMPLVFATGVWRAANLVLLVWGIGATLRASNPVFRQRRFATLAATGMVTALCLFFFREAFLTLYVGQSSIIEFGLVVAIWGWLVSSEGKSARQRILGDVFVGLALAVLATKPQVLGLAVVLVGIWALARRRWTIPISAAVSMGLLFLGPNLLYSWSLRDWMTVVFDWQASSQMKVSASVWGLSYQWLRALPFWGLIAAILAVAGLAVLLPGWWRDLKDRTSPVPLSLPLTLCINSVISPYILGYEHILLLMPALVILGAVGLPGSQASAAVVRGSQLWRMAIYAWIGLLPLIVVSVQAGLDGKEYLTIVQSASMLALCWVAKLEWKRGIV